MLMSSSFHPLLFICRCLIFQSLYKTSFGTDEIPKKSYAGFKIIQAKPTNAEQHWLIRDLNHNGHVRVLGPTSGVNANGQSQPPGTIYVTALVAPDHWLAIQTVLAQLELAYDIIVDDFQKYIDASWETKPPSRFLRKNRRKDRRRLRREVSPDAPPFTLNKYHTLTEIDKYLNDTQKLVPDVMEITTYGKSSEGRGLRAVHIGSKIVETPGSKTQFPKPVVMIDAGIHAREWITVSSAMCLITHLATYYKSDKFLNQFRWIVLPVLNPDGYEYSWNTDRLWRKTRSKPKDTTSVPTDTPPTECYGVDPNRNWGDHWGEKGVQRYNVCTETFAGPYAFSEPEVASLSDLIEYYRERVAIYISLHAFSQVILSPFGHSSGKSVDYHAQVSVMKAGADAIKATSGFTYSYGSIYDAMYAASGSSIDYIYESMGVKNAYVIELRDTGKFGFVLPQKEILPTCKEAVSAVVAMTEAAHKHTTHKKRS